MLMIRKLGAAVLVVIGVQGQQRSMPAGPFTSAQAAAGRAAYQAHCASCHLPDLAGRNEALPLAGSNFMNTWGARSTRDLFAHIRTMPPGSAGSLGLQTYLEIAAFILETNGADAGSQALTSATDVTIRSIATGEVRIVLGDSIASRPRTGLRGITVAGEVKTYVPVTDEMLIHPDPGEWLMIRRNYQAWSYSPLTQITNRNVQDLQLAWVWAMNDGGANQPTPIVHNGIIYLANTSNTVQALDGRTGELIWENHIGPDATIAYGATRSLAIYQDKVFLATTDARMIALDARTGKVVWETVIANKAKGYGNTSGPLVVRGKVLQGVMGCDKYKEDGCFISAYDATSGKLLWKFETVAREGQAGGDPW